jgi:hypothetical protein
MATMSWPSHRGKILAPGMTFQTPEPGLALHESTAPGTTSRRLPAPEQAALRADHHVADARVCRS